MTVGDLIRERARTAGFSHLSTLIEQRIHGTGPDWIRAATVARVVENYLRSGIAFTYLHAPLDPDPAGKPEPAPGEHQLSGR